MITSRSNAWFKRVREAIREHEDEIVIEGPKAVADAMAAGWKPIAVINSESAWSTGVSRSSPERERLKPALNTRETARTKPELQTFSNELFNAIAHTKTSQGVIGLFERPQWNAPQILARRDSVFIALDGVQDPGNTGTIVRLAAAFDAAGVIVLPGCADPYGPKAIRASAGTILHVPVVAMDVAQLLECGLDLYAADSTAASEEPPTRAAVLIFGGEGGGISQELRTRARGVTVATSGRVESLNVAAAASILLWRSFRRRAR